MEKDDCIYVAGHLGLVGSAIMRELTAKGYTNLVGISHDRLDLCDQEEVDNFISQFKPKYIFLAAAKVGGIKANETKPAEFIYSNLQIQMNVIHAAWRHKVEKLLFLGSSCIYPKHALQPIREDFLLSGHLEPTNQAYAIAKIAGIEMCKAYNTQYGTRFMSVMPTNLYGPGDNYDLETSHVLPAIVRRVVDAQEEGNSRIALWGTGTAKREFLHSDDLASACVRLMENHFCEDIINIGSGEEVTIAQLAERVKGIAKWKGEFCWNRNAPDGTPRKLLDSSRITQTGWFPLVSLTEGLKRTINEYRAERTRIIRES